ncbi:MAG: SanA/YdcF family protein [Candidatus Xenobia bacterium]
MKTTLALLGGLAAATAGVSFAIEMEGRRHIVSTADAPAAQCAIVLGCYVGPNGELSNMLEDRVQVAVELYRDKKVCKLLMSGDHGQLDYDEVNAMRLAAERLAAERLGVPSEDIFMDHAGFSTYDTMTRAHRVFLVQSAIVVTQDFHLPRAVWLARRNHIAATGVAADRRTYADASYYRWRDFAARIKAFGDALFNVRPRFLGDPIPITGDGRETLD